MNSFKIVIVLLLIVSGTFGQQPTSSIKPKDFYGQFEAGIRATQVLGKQGLRFTERRDDWVLTVETDRKGATRASYVNAVTGVVDSECIVIGDSIYERRGEGPWTLRTRAEFTAKSAVLGEALNKLRAELRKAHSKEGHDEYERLRAELNIKATIFAVNSQAMSSSSSGILWTFHGDGVVDKVITETGRVTLKGQTVRQYKATGTYNIPVLTVRKERKNLYDHDLWFDEKTGAIVKARARNDLVSDYRTVTGIILFEWEIDPSIAISAPGIQPKRNVS